MTYTIIYRYEQSTLISTKHFVSWKSIQKEYPGYMTSLVFEDLQQLIDFTTKDWGLSAEQVGRLVDELGQNKAAKVDMQDIFQS